MTEIIEDKNYLSKGLATALDPRSLNEYLGVDDKEVYDKTRDLSEDYVEVVGRYHKGVKHEFEEMRLKLVRSFNGNPTKENTAEKNVEIVKRT